MGSGLDAGAGSVDGVGSGVRDGTGAGVGSRTTGSGRWLRVAVAQDRLLQREAVLEQDPVTGHAIAVARQDATVAVRPQLSAKPRKYGFWFWRYAISSAWCASTLST